MEDDVSDTGFSPQQIDTTTPHPARMYDYYLGGMDNYAVDREAAERVLGHAPFIRPTAQGNRVFHHRAVRTVVKQGIRQIIDIGTGIPTSPNTHEVAKAVAPDTRVVYVDNDPIVATYAGAKLTNSGNAGFVLGDLREPDALLDAPVTRELIDFREPVALTLCAVVHFIVDDEGPREILSALTSRLAEGSCLVLSHITADFDEADEMAQASSVYKNSTAQLIARGHDEVLSYFDGFELLEPGLVKPPLWRPDGPVPSEEELVDHRGYAGVGIKGGLADGA
ncbi:SAM-dependent methyltransferase [Streptomyces sp. HNM0575]|uniref:SAM-dependent methyltransferase n=1 Tax=Streptomyces sp. HNM0575 TaxID=2716338 RepID=UPI00145DA6EC|nr:SAM-dependent methyltransferase [Streptomyces sp. HNM0575]NLU73242.1 SAM-dependent methyltransferase [Streptomyces sp. HNM0575]